MNYIKLCHTNEKRIEIQNSKVTVDNHTLNLHIMGWVCFCGLHDMMIPILYVLYTA